ncbi:hypothetical protein GLOIN_2v1774607 [Rhizophagus irregularis DAOM 181602=DAOM 197198]|nr:hypothetical protein RhiirB3_457262 [Rhizophagus irregularis]GET51755.1 hypothetical protein GLOIN_2v1774607 [Rhizophagus irregularis DAOM 181602=DAOM 197198]
MASDSKAQPAKNKQQRDPPKEIQSIITRYDPYPANWNFQQRKERELFQVVVKNIPETVTTLLLYLLDHSQSPISHLGCKAFKVVQKKSTSKLITYYKN